MSKMVIALFPIGAALVAVLLSVSTAAADGGREGDHEGFGGRGRAVPEISAHGAQAALALVVGGAAVVLGRRARRRDR
jgi:hypothetical protein